MTCTYFYYSPLSEVVCTYFSFFAFFRLQECRRPCGEVFSPTAHGQFNLLPSHPNSVNSASVLISFGNRPPTYKISITCRFLQMQGLQDFFRLPKKFFHFNQKVACCAKSSWRQFESGKNLRKICDTGGGRKNANMTNAKGIKIPI